MTDLNTKILIECRVSPCNGFLNRKAVGFELGLTKEQFTEIMPKPELNDVTKAYNLYVAKSARLKEFQNNCRSFLDAYSKLCTDHGLEIDYYMGGDTYGIHESGLSINNAEFRHIVTKD